MLFEKAYAVMDLKRHLTVAPTPLCYNGMELTRDAFEFYLRLVHHFENVVRSIDACQWDLDLEFDVFPGEQIEQVRKFVGGCHLLAAVMSGR